MGGFFMNLCDFLKFLVIKIFLSILSRDEDPDPLIFGPPDPVKFN